MKNYSLKSKLIDVLLMKLLYGKADAIIAQSTDIFNDLIQSYHLSPKKIYIIHNPTTINKLNLVDEVMSNKIKLLSIGRFSPEKGYDRLLQIIQKLPPKFMLQIMGNGPLYEHIKTKAVNMQLKDRVNFLGFLEDEEKLKIMQESNIYIQTSYVEGFPNSLLEAISIGLPVIAFDVPGGTREIVKDLNGCLIPDGNLELMIKELMKFERKSYNPKLMQLDTINRFGLSKVMNDLKHVFTVSNYE